MFASMGFRVQEPRTVLPHPVLEVSGDPGV